jgi:hypothetical protein
MKSPMFVKRAVEEERKMYKGYTESRAMRVSKKTAEM